MMSRIRRSGSRSDLRSEIESRAAQIRSALVVDEKLDPITLDDRVPVLFLIERHFIMQPRTAAFGDLHPQTLPRGLLLFFEQPAELLGRVLGDINHGAANYDLGALSQKTEAEMLSG